MKMAKASTADIEMAMELSRFVEDLVDGMCPKQACADPASDDIEWLEDDPDQQHLKIISALQGIVRKGSIFRVTFGMSVLIDPRNELVDPDADTLEPHPKIGILADQVEALTAERDALKDAARLALVALSEYGNPYNWDEDFHGIRREWKEPESNTPSAYNGFELAQPAINALKAVL